MDKQVWAEVHPFAFMVNIVCEQMGHCVFTTFCSNFFESVCSLQFYLLRICPVCNKNNLPCHINKRLCSKDKNHFLHVPYVWYYITLKGCNKWNYYEGYASPKSPFCLWLLLTQMLVVHGGYSVVQICMTEFIKMLIYILIIIINVNHQLFFLDLAQNVHFKCKKHWFFLVRQTFLELRAPGTVLRLPFFQLKGQKLVISKLFEEKYCW